MGLAQEEAGGDFVQAGAGCKAAVEVAGGRGRRHASVHIATSKRGVRRTDGAASWCQLHCARRGHPKALPLPCNLPLPCIPVLVQVHPWTYSPANSVWHLVLVGMSP